MKTLLEKMHWLIFFYTIFSGYQMYTGHDEMYAEQVARLPVLDNKIKKSKKKVLDLKRYFSDIEVAKKNIERVALEVEKVQKRLPNNIADSENLSLITEIAENINMKEIFIKPGNEIDKGFYFIKNYVLAAEGTYLQALVFFEKIAESKRLLNIKNIKFEKIKKKFQRARLKLMKIRVTVQAYKYNSDFKEERGIEEIEKGFQNKKKPVKKKPKTKKRS